MSYPNYNSGDQRLARKSEAGDSTTQPDNLQSNCVDDDLAELEAWLLSGEIKIVPELPW
jgi:hypothetical protein